MPELPTASTRICTKCGLERDARTDFRPDRATCRKCSNKISYAARVRRVGSSAAAPAPVPSTADTIWTATDAFCEADEQLADAVIAGGAPMIAFGLALERAYADQLLRSGSFAEAARDLGIAPALLRAQLSELVRRAARRGYSPAHDIAAPTPEGYHVKGVSTFYGPDGEVRGQWIKTKADEDHKYALLLDALAKISPAFDSLADPVPVPAAELDDDLLCVYPMGDAHIGMLAWAAETGDDFNIAIAERDLCTAMEQLVAGAPPAREALVIDLGDFFHADNAFGTTTAGTRVDVDTRWAKLMASGVRIARRCIDFALTKHEIVTVIIEIGNHDTHAAVMLAIALAQYYEREPRVRIDTSPAKFHWYRFGKVLIGVTHGDTCKPGDLLGVMATDRKVDWGETEYRYYYCGHVHHATEKEYPGIIVWTFRTLASSDAWHKSKGYRSGQEMRMDVIHREWGKISQNTIGIRRIRSAREQVAS